MPWTLHSSNLNFCNPLCELAAQKSTRNFLPLNEFKSRAAVMAQLVERTLPTPEVQSQSSPKFQLYTFLPVNLIENKNGKEAKNGPFLKMNFKITLGK